MPRVTDLLAADDLIERSPRAGPGAAGRRPDARAADRSRPTATCACKISRAATKAFCWRSAIRPSAAMAAPIRSPAKSASARSRSSSSPRTLGFAVPLGRIAVTECQMINQFHGSATEPPRFTRGYGLVLRPVRAQGDVDGAGRPRAARARARRGGQGAGAGRGVRAVAFRQRAGDRLRRASEAAALRRLPGRARPGPPHARGVRGGAANASRRCRRPRNERAGLQLRLSRRADQADDPPRDPEGDRDPRLSGAVRQPRDADAVRLGHRRRAGDRRDPRARTTCSR